MTESMMKNDKKQYVRSHGILSLLILVGTSVLVCAPVWSGRSGVHRAESLAYQLLEGRKAASSRGPASIESPINHLTQDEGEIGLDPWGHPYRYKLLKGHELQMSKILVWSLGPNGTVETKSELLDSNRDARSPEFSGDDLGIMLSVK